MRGVIDQALGMSTGVMGTGVAMGQLIVAIVGCASMIAFGAAGLYLKWRDSKAIRQALDCGDLRRALEIREKTK